MADEVLLEKRDDRIAILTLNRPKALNAIDGAMAKALRSAIADIEADEAVDVTILTGAGEKAFCVGVDLKERQRLSDTEAEALRTGELFPMYRAFEQRQKPAIALVSGHCLGGGFELALSSDMVLATPEASFGLPEVKWGLIPAAGGCRKLPKLIGMARAKEMILAGRTLGAAEAERLGLVNHVVAPSDRMHRALDLANAILANVQTAVRGAKRCIDTAFDAERTAEFDIEVANRCYAAKERKAGVARFAAGKPGRK